MKEHVTIGIDPSINSTGVCVSGVDNTFNIYYVFPSNITKKAKAWTDTVDWLTVYDYEKLSIKEIDKYYEKEFVKFGNLYVLAETLSIILDIIMDKYDVDFVVMEGVSYGSVKGAALVDLAFLNAMIRLKLVDKKLKYFIVAPTEVKKFAVGNGSAEKSIIINSWKKLDKKTQEIPDYVKCDDLADAYFMAHYDPRKSDLL